LTATAVPGCDGLKPFAEVKGEPAKPAEDMEQRASAQRSRRADSEAHSATETQSAKERQSRLKDGYGPIERQDAPVQAA
jgi:hypothetical protein